MVVPLNHGPLNALIECLESIQSDEEEVDAGGGGGDGDDIDDGGGEDRDGDREEVGDGEGDDIDLNVPDVDTPTRANTEVPATPRRVPSRTITRYLSSPHARRERVKQSPCMFCVEHKDVFTLRDHLERSVLCRTNYYSLLKVNSIDGILLKNYVCLFCEDAGASLKTHLRSSNGCFQSFSEKLNVDTIE